MFLEPSVFDGGKFHPLETHVKECILCTHMGEISKKTKRVKKEQERLIITLSFFFFTWSTASFEFLLSVQYKDLRFFHSLDLFLLSHLTPVAYVMIVSHSNSEKRKSKKQIRIFC